MIKYIKNLIEQKRRAKEIAHLKTLPRYVKAMKGQKEIGFDLTRYYVDYNLKTKTLKLTSKKNGKRTHLVLHKDGKYYV